MPEKERQEIPKVGPVDPTKESSPIEDGPRPEDSAVPDRGGDCWFNGTRYSHGEYICSNGHLLHCWNHRWFQEGSC